MLPRINLASSSCSSAGVKVLTVAWVPTGAKTGVGMSPCGVWMIPQALGFSRDMLVQAMGIFFALSTLTLTLSLGTNGLISWDDGVASSLALLPSFAGIYFGRWTRKRIDEEKFQKVFLYGVMLLGTYLVWRSLASAA